MAATTLLERVQRYLYANRRHIPAICKATGLQESWMKKVAFRHIPDPGVRKIELIDAYRREQRRKKKRSARASSSQSSRTEVNQLMP